MKKHNEESARKTFLHGRIIVVVVIGIIAIFATAVGIALISISKYLMKEANERYQIVTDNVAEEITTWFSNEAQIVANQKAALEIAGDYDPDVLTAYMTRIVEDYNEEGYIYDLYFVNTDNVMSSGYGYIPDPSIDFRERVWYRNALKIDGLYYSAPYKDSYLDRYVVTISSVCYKPNGELAGVIALDIFVDTLFSIANEKVLDGDSYCFLIDNAMGIATHPNERYAYVNDMPMTLTSVPGNQYDDIVKFIRGDETDSATSVHYSINDFDGVKRTVYVSKIECCSWYVVAAIESSVYTEPLVKTLLLVVLTLIICLVVGIISTGLFTSRAIRQLNEANEIAQEASEAKSIFLANMSHEIRTPINAIIGMNEMVIRENNEPNINDYALDIASASRSLVTIVNDILDFSKIESGNMELVKTEFNIASVINDIVNMSEARAEGKDLSLFFEIDPEIPVGLIGDEMRIKQIILNMMTNGIKYTNIGFVTMRVEFTKQEYGINLNVFVKDTGIGIAEENIDRLYQSFRRFDAKRNRSIEGTGLGLSITKKLVQAMGGFINVTSKLGVGTEFSVCIPLEVSNARPFITIDHPEKYKFVTLFDHNMVDIRIKNQTERIIKNIRKGFNLDVIDATTFEQLSELVRNDSKISHIVVNKSVYLKNESYFEALSHEKTVIVLQKRGQAEELPPTIISHYLPFYSISLAALLNNKRQAVYAGPIQLFDFEAPDVKVLIVDDNAMNLKVAAGLMKPYNMKVTTVDSGIKAIELLKEDPTYDIVFMDHMMPDMDGIETTARLRNIKNAYFRELPIVALTANTVNNAKKIFLESGFNDFLAKPINVNFLDRMLRLHLPKDKIHPANHKEQPAEISAKTAASTKQEEAGQCIFDAQLGLTYTAGNKELYLDILKEYVEKATEMKNFITSSFKSEDWSNYVIKVHALKSTSLTIGAAPLSELAKELELSGKAAKYDLILQKTDLLLEQYEDVLKAAEGYLNEHNIFIATAVEQEIAAVSDENIDHEIIDKYAAAFKIALEEFDTDQAEEIYAKVTQEGNVYGRIFSKIIEQIRNFEYDLAEEEIERIMGR
ncbi:MAG: ATP-binding protein [Lachnospiraceae bacterium]|nr:ATP-binding protein [Lachnospiraceae bacterium]